MKKISQINALKAAENITGQISNEIESRETESNSINATTRYPINDDRKKQIADTDKIATVLRMYCLPLPSVLNKNFCIAGAKVQSCLCIKESQFSA